MTDTGFLRQKVVVFSVINVLRSFCQLTCCCKQMSVLDKRPELPQVLCIHSPVDVRLYLLTFFPLSPVLCLWYEILMWYFFQSTLFSLWSLGNQFLPPSYVCGWCVFPPCLVKCCHTFSKCLKIPAEVNHNWIQVKCCCDFCAVHWSSSWLRKSLFT